jgi:hypothetical protein
MESSWDRAGGNNDAFNGRRRKGEVYTVADLKGPGVIRRFYAARPGGHLRIFLDDAATPAVDMKCEDFFSGRHAPFLRPAVGPMGGSNYAYFPIPYAKAARIEITALRPAQEPWGVYYQVTYETLPAGSRVETLRLPLGKEDQQAWDAALAAWRNLGHDPKPPAAGQQTASRRVRLAPGERREVLRLDGAGVIDRFRLRIAPADQAMLRSTKSGGTARSRTPSTLRWATSSATGSTRLPTARCPWVSKPMAGTTAISPCPSRSAPPSAW